MSNSTVCATVRIAGEVSLSELAEMAFRSGYYRDISSAEQAYMVLLAGAELGFGPHASLDGVSIVHGKPEIGAHLLAAAVMRSEKYRYQIEELTTQRCAIRFFERIDGDWHESGVSTFSGEDAKQAKLHLDRRGKPNTMYARYARNMLFARAMSNGQAWYAPDVTCGPVYSAGEISGPDADPRQNLLPEEAREAAGLDLEAKRPELVEELQEMVEGPPEEGAKPAVDDVQSPGPHMPPVEAAEGDIWRHPVSGMIFRRDGEGGWHEVSEDPQKPQEEPEKEEGSDIDPDAAGALAGEEPPPAPPAKAKKIKKDDPPRSAQGLTKEEWDELTEDDRKVGDHTTQAQIDYLKRLCVRKGITGKALQISIRDQFPETKPGQLWQLAGTESSWLIDHMLAMADAVGAEVDR